MTPTAATIEVLLLLSGPPRTKAYLSDRTGLTQRAVKRRLKAFDDHGLLEAQATLRGLGNRRRAP